MKITDTFKNLCKPVSQKRENILEYQPQDLAIEGNNKQKEITREKSLVTVLPNTIFANNFIATFLILAYLLVYGLSFSALLKCLILYKIFCLGLSILVFYVLPKCQNQS